MVSEQITVDLSSDHCFPDSPYQNRITSSIADQSEHNNFFDCLKSPLISDKYSYINVGSFNFSISHEHRSSSPPSFADFDQLCPGKTLQSPRSV